MSPQTRKEISNIGWIHLADLPGYSKKNKNAHPGIKLYMVTPFLSGLRKWISQNRHMKGKLIPVEEDGLLEDAIQDEVVQNGTTNDLIAMLRRQQPPDQEVDLLGMLRNGNTGQPHYQMPLHPAESYHPRDAMSYTFHQPGNSQQVYDLMEFSPRIEPTRDSKQESVQPPLPPPPVNPLGPINEARQDTLLPILKGGPSKEITENKETNPFLENLFKSSKQTGSDHAYVTDSTKSKHQESLLSMLKSPQLSTTTPPTRDIKPMHSIQPIKTQPTGLSSQQMVLLSNLKSPPLRPTLSSTESHQYALLATLKPNQIPSDSPQSPTSKASPAPPASSHQNSLLSVLKSPKLESQTDHKSSFLATLKMSPPSIPATKSAATASSDRTATTQPRMDTASSLLARVQSPPVPRSTPNRSHEASLLSALKSPTLPSVPSTLPVSQTPSSEHMSSLLSSLKSSPSTAPAPVKKKDGGNVVENRSSDVKNVHMESLLKTLKSPSASPTIEKITPSETMREEVPGKTDAPSAQINGPKIATVDAVVNSTPEIPEAPMIGHVATGSGRAHSLLSALRGPKAQVGQVGLGTTSTKDFSSIADKNDKPVVPGNKKQTQTIAQAISSANSAVPTPIASSATVVQNPAVTVNSLLNSFKGKSNTTAPIAPTTHQKSLLSVLSPSTPPTQPPPSRTSPKPQQFNFSPNPQVGKRIKFRETLVPGGGIKEFQPEHKTNGNAIDLGKVRLLRRPTPEPPAAHTEPRRVTESQAERAKPQVVNGKSGSARLETARGMADPYLSLPSTTVLSQPDIEKGGIIRMEPGNITVLKRLEPATGAKSSKPETASMETKPESPLGIEFPFRRRTPSKGSSGSPTPTTTPTRAHSRSLLALLQGPPVEVKKEETVNDAPKVDLEENANSPLSSARLEPSDVAEEGAHSEGLDDTERVGTEREMKLIAMLERALARGVPS